jgi:hypothetical protein
MPFKNCLDFSKKKKNDGLKNCLGLDVVGLLFVSVFEGGANVVVNPILEILDKVCSFFQPLKKNW